MKKTGFYVECEVWQIGPYPSTEAAERALVEIEGLGRCSLEHRIVHRHQLDNCPMIH